MSIAAVFDGKGANSIDLVQFTSERLLLVERRLAQITLAPRSLSIADASITTAAMLIDGIVWDKRVVENHASVTICRGPLARQYQLRERVCVLDKMLKENEEVLAVLARGDPNAVKVTKKRVRKCALAALLAKKLELQEPKVQCRLRVHIRLDSPPKFDPAREISETGRLVPQNHGRRKPIEQEQTKTE
ncbi:hypothetical protein BDZ45DRAFT_775244 [Acephala macrosclerotiorum]|nr:hypothetical protein BDZ45DRAFT_775244 [Acephala macrosclerotiorum]